MLYGRDVRHLESLAKLWWVQGDIPKHFSPGRHRVSRKTIELIAAGKEWRTEDARKAMAESGLRPATIEEGFSLVRARPSTEKVGESEFYLPPARPELQLQFPIVTLGSSWEPRDVPLVSWVPSFTRDIHGHRILTLADQNLPANGNDDFWPEVTRFAGVPLEPLPNRVSFVD